MDKIEIIIQNLRSVYYIYIEDFNIFLNLYIIIIPLLNWYVIHFKLTPPFETSDYHTYRESYILF